VLTSDLIFSIYPKNPLFPHEFPHAVGLFKIPFEEVAFQMVLEDGQGLCSPSFRGKLVPPLECQDREELGLG
jgi:hypothetical protein